MCPSWKLYEIAILMENSTPKLKIEKDEKIVGSFCFGERNERDDLPTSSCNEKKELLCNA